MFIHFLFANKLSAKSQTPLPRFVVDLLHNKFTTNRSSLMEFAINNRSHLQKLYRPMWPGQPTVDPAQSIIDGCAMNQSNHIVCIAVGLCRQRIRGEITLHVDLLPATYFRGFKALLTTSHDWSQVGAYRDSWSGAL